MDTLDPITQNAVQNSGDAVSILLLKKAQDQQESQSQQLLQSLPQAPNMEHQGQKLDVTA